MTLQGLMERRYLYKASRTGFSGIRTHPMYGSEVMTEAVQNNPARKRYQLEAEGHIAATYYELADGVITFIHTEVPKELEGKGIGSKLVKGALDQVRAAGLKVVPRCPFVKAYIEKHSEYADLLK
jgi:predicted GNAT family acetyltransferase